jgi:Integron Cassette Protein Hfx_Cass5
MSTKTAHIAAVFVDEHRRLCVRPEPPHNFSHVYRTAMEVHWDEERGCLYSPVPREWSYVRWYEQIVAAVLDEYGVHLAATKDTTFQNAPPEVQNRVQEDAGLV